MHSVALGAGWKVPGGQAAQIAAPKPSEYRPGVHSLQSLSATEPRLGFAEPGGQSVHCSAALSPVSLLCVPGGHGCQTMEETAPASAQKPPGGHGRHVLCMMVSANVPAGHGVQLALVLATMSPKVPG